MLLHPRLKKVCHGTKNVSHFRSINLQTQVLKTHHDFLHAHVNVLMALVVHASQCGGVPGRGCDMSGANPSWTLSCTREMDICVQVLYVDIQSAFYSVIRDLLLDSKSTAESLDDLLQRIGIPLALQWFLRKSIPMRENYKCS